MQQHIIYEKQNGIALIKFNRPEVLNAFLFSMIDDLLGILEDVRADDAVRVLVFNGNGRAFSAGIDLAEQAQLFGGEIMLQTARQHLMQLQDLTRALVSLPKPLIAAINGAAVGIGAELAIGCDVRLAAQEAYFLFAEVKRGLYETNGVTYFLPRLVGYGRAMEMMLTGDKYGASEALAAGLVTHVLPSDELLPFALDMAGRMAKNAPISMQLVKTGMGRAYDLDLEGMLQWEIDGMMACLCSEDLREGVQAFLEKREPRYSGK